MSQHAAPPPEDVLRAFCVAGPIQPLAGGQSQSFTNGTHVLKLVDDPVESEFCAGLLARLADHNSTAFSVPKPVRSTIPDASYIVQSWTCTMFVPGKTIPRSLDQWKLLLSASRAFHATLRDLVEAKPPFIDERRGSHRWNLAQQVAFGERLCPTLPQHAVQMLQRLDALRPMLLSLPEDDVDYTPQLVHGDIAGNVLFSDSQAPAIIDFSPYWRPVAYAEAVAVSDGLVEYDAGVELVHIVGTGRGRMEMLLKAMVFRVISDWLGSEDSMVGMFEKWERAIDVVRDIMISRKV
ncbi:hypothetical protein EXIGLDRAFT_759693 [Exidia glandulosa HHB12029]|uniref:Aminoglycoside phosphotransferase domain-containing protein n=1 Tax=Exidia glandulosa HHB12029 TaxID=1314781 RepID=A0A165PRE6_EXIGL|nr:hypothetical protein EXIGLDRAFT_759693 [Exidia glandulosa HHB12029]